MVLLCLVPCPEFLPRGGGKPGSRFAPTSGQARLEYHRSPRRDSQTRVMAEIRQKPAFGKPGPPKSVARTADELAKWFVALPEARLCLDVAHARQLDTTLILL